nr:hypothetical protein [Candidatus Aenigmarchaeota archaeon]
PGSRLAADQIFAKSYLKLKTGNNTFDNFGIKRRNLPWLVKGVISIMLIIAIGLWTFAQNIPVAYASPDVLYLHETASSICSGTNRLEMDKDNNTGDTTDNSSQAVVPDRGVDVFVGGNTNPVTWIFTSTLSEAYTLTGNVTYYWSDQWTISGRTGQVKFYIYDVDPSGCSFTDITGGSPDLYTDTTHTGITTHSWTGSTSYNYTFSVDHSIAIRVEVRIQGGSPIGGGFTYTFYYDSETYDTRVNMPGTIVPENLLYFIPFIPLLPKFMEFITKRKNHKIILKKDKK